MPVLFNLTYDPSVDSAPAAFKTVVANVAQFFQNNFTDNVTLNITVAYAAIDGLGESSYGLGSYSYTQIKNALAANATSGDDASAVASLPNADPISGTHTYYMVPAEAKALGLPFTGSSDGTVTFSNSAPFDYDNSNGVPVGQYDFAGTVAHEFSEVMGREMLTGTGNNAQSGPHNGYYPLDLFHFSAPETRSFVGMQAGYFSIDTGHTNLNHFNTSVNGDWGDWAASAGNDAARAFSDSGVVNPFTETDLREMDVLGWDRAQPTPPPSPVSVVDSAGFGHIDFNADGKGDLLWRNANGAAGIWEMDGSSPLAELPLQALSLDWKIAGIRDFDGDSKSDILWRNDNGANGLWEMNADGSTKAQLGVKTMSSDWKVAGVGDFDHDAIADILWRNDNGANGLWEMNGNTAKAELAVNSISSDWSVAGIGDFDGDGKSDLLWRNNNGANGVWLMNGNAATAETGLQTMSPDWKVAGIGDFNGDSRSDIFWRNDNGAEGVWLMNGVTVTAQLSIKTMSSDWNASGNGDYNGDTKSDIFWRNDNGADGMWLMNGNTITAELSVKTMSPDWHVLG